MVINHLCQVFGSQKGSGYEGQGEGKTIGIKGSLKSVKEYKKSGGSNKTINEKVIDKKLLKLLNN